jgi:peptide/nickel transport system permease protein
MLGLIVSRLVLLFPTMIGISFLVFAGLHFMPGDPVMTMLAASNTVATPEEMAIIRRELGLDDPWPVQYFRFLGDAVQGDLGRSWRTNQRVISMIAEQYGSTVQLTVAGLALALILGVGFGSVAAVFHGRFIDTLTMLVAMLGVSMPNFWAGLLLIYLFSVKLGWIRITGPDDFARLIMPAAVLGLSASAAIARLVRSSMLEVLRTEFVIAARSKGLRERTVIMRHALINALIPAVTVLGLQFGNLLAGSVIIEVVFARQGIGQLTVTAIQEKDYPVVQGVVLLMSITYVLVNLVVDVTYGYLDPRIRYG